MSEVGYLGSDRSMGLIGRERGGFVSQDSATVCSIKTGSVDACQKLVVHSGTPQPPEVSAE